MTKCSMFSQCFSDSTSPNVGCRLFTHVHMKDSGDFGHLCVFLVSLHDPHLVIT